jgi:hypothetical protein
VEGAGKRGLYVWSKETELKKPRSNRKGEAANRSFEVHAVINLAKGERLAIGKEIEFLLDALAVGGSIAHIDAIFVRVYRGTGKGGAR